MIKHGQYAAGGRTLEATGGRLGRRATDSDAAHQKRYMAHAMLEEKVEEYME
jgi:hypothetical protein